MTDLPGVYQDQLDAFDQQYAQLQAQSLDAQKRAAESPGFSGGQLAAAALTTLLPIAIGGLLAGRYGVQAGGEAGAAGLKVFDQTVGQRLEDKRKLAALEAQQLQTDQRNLFKERAKFERDAARDVYRADEKSKLEERKAELRAGQRSGLSDLGMGLRDFAQAFGKGPSLTADVAEAGTDIDPAAVTEQAFAPEPDLDSILESTTDSERALIEAMAANDMLDSPEGQRVVQKMLSKRPEYAKIAERELAESEDAASGLIGEVASNPLMTSKGGRDAAKDSLTVAKGMEDLQTKNLEQTGKSLGIVKTKRELEAGERERERIASIEKDKKTLSFNTISPSDQKVSKGAVTISLESIPDAESRKQAQSVIGVYEDVFRELDNIGSKLKEGTNLSRFLKHGPSIEKSKKQLNLLFKQLQTSRVKGGDKAGGLEFSQLEDILSTGQGTFWGELSDVLGGNTGLSPKLEATYNESVNRIRNALTSHLRGLGATVEVQQPGQRQLPNVSVVPKGTTLSDIDAELARRFSGVKK